MLKLWIVKNNVAYADDDTLAIKVVNVYPDEEFKLWVEFNGGELKVFDFKPLIRNMPAFSRLSNLDVFRSVDIDHGVPVWYDGEIDIAPETLYNEGIEYSPAVYR